ncbi:MAG: sigma-54 dependent transcriptional regulator [Candidatus Aminicenantales bacterium]
MKDKILVIDDEVSIRSSLQGILEDEGYSVQTAETGEGGLQLLKNQNFGLILLDIWLPEMSGLEVLEQVQQMEDRPQVVVISGHGTIETAVKATKFGAFDFLEKPLSLEKVVVTAKNALRQAKLEEENIQLREKIKARYHLVGKSPLFQKLRKDIKTAAPTNGRILLFGENGTGKDLIAHLIHQQSRRKDKRFIEINCAAVPDELIESELFGYIKGFFMSASKDKKGKLLLADGGTLFLDEIGEMSLKTQAKFVKAIEEQEFEPLGSTETVGFDTRIIAATSKKLKDLIVRGKFKEDLLFKLNVIPLTIPPLRERTEDIPLLINYFLKYFSAEYGKKSKTMHPEAIRAFLNYSWPGNVSELMNVIERFVILVEEEEIGPSHLSLLVEAREQEQMPGLNNHTPLGQASRLFEKNYIHRALIKNNWSLAKTASDLKISQEGLNEKIKSLNITFLD